MVPLPDPDGVTVHQLWLLDTVQVVLEVTVKEVFPAEVVTCWPVGEIVNIGEAAA